MGGDGLNFPEKVGNLSYYNTSNLPFSEFCFIYFPDYMKISSEAITDNELEIMTSNCNTLMDVLINSSVCINRALLFVLSFGSLLNILVLFLLIMSFPKNATDVYLMSITIGDIIICLASIMSTQLPEDFGSAFTAATAEVLGNIGQQPLRG